MDTLPKPTDQIKATTPTTAEATARLWIGEPHHENSLVDIYRICGNRAGTPLLVAKDVSPIHAPTILLAVNNHDALVARCQSLVEALDSKPLDPCVLGRERELARQALAAIEGGA